MNTNNHRIAPRYTKLRVVAAVMFVTWLSLSACAITPRNAAIAGFASCQAVDVWQTSWALQNGYEEANPMMGEDPSVQNMIVTKVAVVAAGALIYRILPDRYKTAGMAMLTTPCAAAVAHNYSIGVRP